MSQILILAVSMVLMIGLTGGAYAQEAAPQRNEFVSEDHGFVVEFPEGWTVTTEVPGTVVAGLSPQEGPEDAFMENIVVTAEELPADMTLPQYFDAVVSALSQSIPGFEMMGSGDVTSEYCEFLWITYRANLSGLELVQNIHLTIRDGLGYALIASSAPNSFEAHAPEFEAAVASFRFK